MCKQRRIALRGAVALVAAGLLGAACSSSPAKGASTGSTSEAITRTCQRIADVLSDGPDPDADPVGYALAQVRPLRQITTTDRPLRTAIAALASAYETVYTTNDAKGTEAAVNRAGKKIDAICPGAF